MGGEGPLDRARMEGVALPDGLSGPGDCLDSGRDSAAVALPDADAISARLPLAEPRAKFEQQQRQPDEDRDHEAGHDLACALATQAVDDEQRSERQPGEEHDPVGRNSHG